MQFAKKIVAALGLLAVWNACPQAARGQSPMSPRREAVYNKMLNFESLVKGGAVAPHWMLDGHSFWYVEGAPANTVIEKVDPAANTVAPLFDTAKLRSALAAVLGHKPPYEGVPFQNFDFLDGERAVRFTVEGRAFELNLGSYTVTPVPGPNGSIASTEAPNKATAIPLPQGGWTVFAKENNLWLRSSVSDRSYPLTTDGEEKFAWGLTPKPWAPHGTLLFAEKVDDRKVYFLPVAHWLIDYDVQITHFLYPATGQAMERTELYTIDSLSGKQTRIDTGKDPNVLIFPLGWRPDGSEVLFLRADRLLKHVDLVASDGKTGESHVLLTERQKTFIEGLDMVFSSNPGNLFYPFPADSRFVWRSERTGWSNLYLYGSNGNLLRPLTSGESPVESVAAIDEKGGWVYYLASGDPKRPYDVQLYRVDMEGKRASRLTDQTGVHSAVFSPDKEYFLDTSSTVDRPPSVVLRKADGTKVRVLAAADISELKALGWRPPEEFRVKAADGKMDLYGDLYKPYDFDPARHYPVIDLQYMGNFVHATPRTFMGGFVERLGDDAQSLTQLGFIVFIVDGRGTTGRGKAFQDFTYGHVGQIEVPDHVAVLRELAAKRPYMDTSRVGITGWSWGGYYTIRALLTAPDVFKVGVAGAPVVDFMAGQLPIEPYMGLPQDNVKGYEQGSNLRIADRLKGKLLIAIGTSDTNVTFGHTMRLANAFIQAGKRFDLMVFPGQTHRLDLSAKAYFVKWRNQYFVQYLKP